MRFAVLAAGAGSRLRDEGIVAPKPLAPVGGETLIGRLLRIFTGYRPEAVYLVLNENAPDVSAFVREWSDRLPLRVTVCSTPSSMHSLYALSEAFRESRCCVTTVDTIFSEPAFDAYLKAFDASSADALMGVTDYIDDEKPLYVETDAAGRIGAFRDAAPEHPRYVSAGIYGLTPVALPVLERCVAAGVSRMRNFQRELLSAGCRVDAFPMGPVFDVDHRSDLMRADSFLAGFPVF